MLSVIIPSRPGTFLQKTIDDILENAAGEIEIIAVLDGFWLPIKDDKRVVIIHRGSVKGMRNGINSGVNVAKGEFIMKLDDHVKVGPGFDKILAADCEEDWLVIPRRKRLDAENWAIQNNGKPDIDYMYLSHPSDLLDFGGPGLHGRTWDQKNKDESLRNILIDDVMSCQGSGWFMRKDYFHKLELMDEVNYGPFSSEAQEIGLKCWLSGGRMIVNKKTWYAHLHKGSTYGRGYFLDERWLTKGVAYTKKWIENSAWDKQTLDFSSLIEKFMPLPEWDEDKLNYIRRFDKFNKRVQ